jgi:hypothetical protein
MPCMYMLWLSIHGRKYAPSGTNYLIPVDAAMERESDAEIEAVSAQAVLATLDMVAMTTVPSPLTL